MFDRFFSGPENLVTKVAGNRNAFQMFCFNMPCYKLFSFKKDLLYTEWKFMYLKGVSRCQVLDRNDTLSCLDKRWKWQILWPWETSEFGAIHSQFVWDWHKESHSLAWEMVTRRVPKPHKAPPLLFTSLQDSFHRNRGQSHLKQISRPFESKRLPRTHGWLEISPQNKTLWDQTVPNFAMLWWLWLFNIHGKVQEGWADFFYL